MFFVPRTNVVESDSGFSVEVLGRTGLLYREGGKSVRVDSEVQLGPSGMIVGASSIRHWDSPHEHLQIDDQTKRRIVENIQQAFRFSGFEIEVVW